VDCPNHCAPLSVQRKPICACGGGCPGCLGGLVIQPKLRIGQPDDKYEQEADQTADRIMRMPELENQRMPARRLAKNPSGRETEDDEQIRAKPIGAQITPRVQRQTQSEEEEEEEELIQTKEVAGQTADVVTPNLGDNIISLIGGGRPLSESERAFFEPRFGHDFRQVRVHADTRAAESARSINARAYTFGHDVVFGAGQYYPGISTSQNLLAHELTHIVQQAGKGGLVLQRQPRAPTEATEGEEDTDEVGDIIVGGLETVAEQAKDNNPKVKKEIIEPLEREARRQWERLSTGEQVLVGGFGAATLGMTLGAMLSDPTGREALDEVNLATPLRLIPYMPLTEFRYTLPTAEEGPERLFRLRTTFSGDEWLDLLRDRNPGLPPLSLEFGMDWGYDLDSDHLNVIGAQATLRVLGGITLSGGTFARPPAPPEISATPEGSFVESRGRLPEPPAGPPRPGFQVMLSVDLMKLDRSFLPLGVRRVLGAF
jgi:hypothetical protein